MKTDAYPTVITRLPEADVPLEGIRDWLSQGDDPQILFLDIEAGSEIPAHHHGEQWGIVVEGELEWTLADVTHRYRAGDSYHIPAGTVHQSRFLTRVVSGHGSGPATGRRPSLTPQFSPSGISCVSAFRPAFLESLRAGPLAVT